MKKILVLVLCFAAVSLFAQQNRPISWTMALQNVKTGELVTFSAPVQSFSGEQFRIIISPSAACFCYIVAESPDGDEVEVLFTGPMKSGESWYSPIMQLAPPRGQESLFVIVSRDEQRTLAQRITSFKNNSGSIQRRALMNEVFRLRSDVSRFREEPEKPVLMGGAARGAPEKSMGVEFSGLVTYVKTISIEH